MLHAASSEDLRFCNNQVYKKTADIVCGFFLRIYLVDLKIDELAALRLYFGLLLAAQCRTCVSFPQQSVVPAGQYLLQMRVAGSLASAVPCQ